MGGTQVMRPPFFCTRAQRTTGADVESLAADVARPKALVPSNSHIMMDVQWHWTNLVSEPRTSNREPRTSNLEPRT
jgi:hypothetical protein